MSTTTSSKSGDSCIQKLRVGILGVATISRKTANAILNDESGCTVTFVASRSEEKAKTFVESISSSTTPSIAAIGGDSAYDTLIQSDYVDAVYIPLPTTLHKVWVMKALQAGKHVLVEKPVSMSSNDYQEMLESARKQGKFLMDGTMFQHHNRLSDIVTHVKEYSGSVDRIHAAFSFMGDEEFKRANIRTQKDCDPFGCIGDLGWYCIRFALVVYRSLGYGDVEGAKVVDYKLTPDGVPLDCTCVVRFKEGRVLWFHCGFETQFRQNVEICGANHRVTVDDFVLPRDPPNHFVIESGRYDRESKVSQLKPLQEVLMWKQFSQICCSVEESGWESVSELGKMAQELGSLSLVNQKVIDALMESIEMGGVDVPII